MILENTPKKHNFGEVLSFIQKEWGTAYRLGWNATNQYIYFKPTETVKANHIAHDVGMDHNGEIIIQGHIIFKTSKNQFVPWTPSQTDLLANDWILDGYTKQGI